MFATSVRNGKDQWPPSAANAEDFRAHARPQPSFTPPCPTCLPNPRTATPVSVCRRMFRPLSGQPAVSAAPTPAEFEPTRPRRRENCTRSESSFCQSADWSTHRGWRVFHIDPRNKEAPACTSGAFFALNLEGREPVYSFGCSSLRRARASISVGSQSSAFWYSAAASALRPVPW